MLYERARPVFVDIDPRTLNLDVDAAAAAITSRTSAFLPVHIFGYPADVPALERHGLPIVEDACEALGAVHADGVRVGGRGHPAAFGFYANKQLTTGEGGMLTMGSASSEGRRGLRAQPGPRAGHGLARPRPARLQLPARPTSRARWGWRSWSGSTGCSRLARGSRRWYREALSGFEGLELPCEDATATCAAGSCSSSSSRTASDRDDTIRALAERGIQSKPYLPAIHLMSFYRERFGHREGEFPICEDVAARSIALPFFPEMTEGQVAEVAETLDAVLYSALR